MSHAIALDVGGTTTTLGFIHEDNQTIDYAVTVDTEPGLEKFPFFLRNLVKKHVKLAGEDRILTRPMLYVGLPGNFEPGSDIRPSFGSARQLILKNEEFQTESITDWLMQHFPKGMGLFGVNDALAQAVGAMRAQWCDDFKGKVMVYLGPGTGLGGAILKLGDDPNTFEVITDGHLYDICVTIRGQKCMAEDVLSGRGIFEQSGVVAKDLSERDDCWNQHPGIVDDCSGVAIQIINDIQHQRVTKTHHRNQWLQTDMARISDVGVIMLGGSIGTQGRLGAHIARQLSNAFSIPVCQSSNPSQHALLGVLALARHTKKSTQSNDAFRE